MQVLLANPRGFCAGVDRAISIVERALDLFGPPIYVRHEVVHNRYVVDGLRNRGAVFVDELDAIPAGAIVIFSAHGVSQAVRQDAKSRGFKVFDATCPLVTKVHMEVTRASRRHQECVLIGHAGHPEVEGTMGQYDRSNGGDIYLVEDEADVAALQVRNPEELAFVTQTTLSMDDTSRVIDALRARLKQVFGARDFAEQTDPDSMLYSGGFFSDADRQLMNRLRETPPAVGVWMLTSGRPAEGLQTHREGGNLHLIKQYRARQTQLALFR